MLSRLKCTPAGLLIQSSRIKEFKRFLLRWEPDPALTWKSDSVSIVLWFMKRRWKNSEAEFFWEIENQP